MTDDQISPFSNGTEYLDWEQANCVTCRKCFAEPMCQIMEAIATAALTTGSVSTEMGTRMGWRDGTNWACAEKETRP